MSTKTLYNVGQAMPDVALTKDGNGTCFFTEAKPAAPVVLRCNVTNPQPATGGYTAQDSQVTVLDIDISSASGNVTIGSVNFPNANLNIC